MADGEERGLGSNWISQEEKRTGRKKGDGDGDGDGHGA